MPNLEDVAHKFENEAMKNPEEAAASMKLLESAQQNKIFNQMQKDADQNNASFSVERNKQGEVTAINFTPLFTGSDSLGHVDARARK